MSGGMLDADTDTLARAAKMAAVVVQEIEGNRKSLEGQVNSVIPGQWSMMQSQALLVAFKKWDGAIRNLCQKLEKLGGDTQFAMNDYMQTDEQGASCFNGAGGDGGGPGDGGDSGGDGGSKGDAPGQAGGQSSSTYAFAGLLRV